MFEAKVQLSGLAGQFLQGRLQHLQACFCRGDGLTIGSDLHALATLALQQALGFQQGIGFGNGHRVDGMSGGHFAHRGQASAGWAGSSADQAGDLADDLAIDRVGRAGLDV
ncbi:hypothetical protein D3C84_955730 [compost metagenome]